MCIRDRSNPEAAARAQSLVDQLEKAVADLQTALDKAQASGNAKKVSEATAALEARQQWLAQALSFIHILSTNPRLAGPPEHNSWTRDPRRSAPLPTFPRLVDRWHFGAPSRRIREG